MSTKKKKNKYPAIPKHIVNLLRAVKKKGYSLEQIKSLRQEP